MDQEKMQARHARPLRENVTLEHAARKVVWRDSRILSLRCTGLCSCSSALAVSSLFRQRSVGLEYLVHREHGGNASISALWINLSRALAQPSQRSQPSAACLHAWHPPAFSGRSLSQRSAPHHCSGHTPHAPIHAHSQVSDNATRVCRANRRRAPQHATDPPSSLSQPQQPVTARPLCLCARS